MDVEHAVRDHTTTRSLCRLCRGIDLAVAQRQSAPPRRNRRHNRALRHSVRRRPPNPQSYPPAQVQAGQPLFSAQCGFCHGRDAAGGESGPDLTRSALVAADVRGDKIGPVVQERTRRQGHAAVQSVGWRPGCDGRVHPRSKSQGRIGAGRPAQRGRRRPSDRQRRQPASGISTAPAAVRSVIRRLAISPASRNASRVCRCCTACSIRDREVTPDRVQPRPRSA